MPILLKSMKYLPGSLLMSVCISLTSICHADPMPIRAGLWEITVKMEMPGMPLAMQPMTINNCLTEEQVKNPDEAVARLNSPEQGSDCKVDKYKLDGKTATWTMNCSGPQTMRGEGRVIFENAEAYHGTVKMQMGGSQLNMTMMQTMQAHRVGDCKS